ncbi:MAG: hypothetical protein ABI230_07035 [Aestuariivirga sp.]
MARFSVEFWQAVHGRRFGNTELQVMLHFHKMEKLNIFRRLLDPIETWRWSFSWQTLPLKDLEILSGFFPRDEKLIRNFVNLMHECILDVDLLASWAKGEIWFEEELKKTELCRLGALESYEHFQPWTQHLAGRKVLIVHPFEATIKSQYEKKRTKLFADQKVLPEFELHTLKAVQSIAGNRPDGFDTWFDALDDMTDKATASPADVVILGCGAYGFPLAARLKRAGKQCIHLGGSTQRLFGIKGSRDESPSIKSFAEKYYNEFWVRPAVDERPKGAELVEGACYW